MKRNCRDYLMDILNAIDETAEFTADMSYEEFCMDRKTSNAVVRSLEVLGEAVRNVPDVYKRRAPEIPWAKMLGMRNRLIHEYFGVDLEIVWKTVKVALPPLRTRIQTLLAEIDKEGGG